MDYFQLDSRNIEKKNGRVKKVTIVMTARAKCPQSPPPSNPIVSANTSAMSCQTSLDTHQHVDQTLSVSKVLPKPLVFCVTFALNVSELVPWPFSRIKGLLKELRWQKKKGDSLKERVERTKEDKGNKKNITLIIREIAHYYQYICGAHRKKKHTHTHSHWLTIPVNTMLAVIF